MKQARASFGLQYDPDGSLVQVRERERQSEKETEGETERERET